MSTQRAEIFSAGLRQTTAQEYPPNWDPQETNCVLVALAPGSEEWLDVEQKFRKTMPAGRLLRVERVQNQLTWRRFSATRKFLFDKHGQPPEQRDLFHGTRSLDPPRIYEMEGGFDMKYSRAGMWGCGTYFAVNASYSCSGYAYTAPDGTKQVFLARVLVGKYEKRSPDSKIIKPSPLPEDPTRFYDSVQGHTDGSDVFIVYENNQAYPQYLLTFADQ